MSSPSNPKTPIAIVGIGCVLPDAADLASFWAITVERRCAIRPLRGSAWEWERLPLSSPVRGGQVEGFAPDWRAFRLPPADAASMNPMQLYVLEAGRQALGAVRHLPWERTAIWIGATGLGWRPDTGLRVRLDALCDAVRSAAPAAGLDGEVLRGALVHARASLDAQLLPANEEPVVNSAASIAAGRLAMLFDVRGPHGAVDAGFASGLAALDVACRTLREGTVDCAVAGGVSELLSPAELTALDRMGVLSRGDARPFDADADGTVPGEGAVLFALKRLEDAVRDGDQVHAVVLGIGAACDAPTGSVLSPRSDGQALAMRRALSDAGADPGTIGFVECHATGTPRGDAAELAALGETFADVTEPVALGSAKATVGHLRGAAGAVGLLRAVTALANGTIPPQAGFSTPSGAVRSHGGRFVIPTSARPLGPRGGAARARATVGAASLGGIAYHAVLEAHVPAATAPSHPARARRATKEAIAIIGLGGVFPGAPSVPRLWDALLAGRDAIREVPPERWDASSYCDPDPHRLERSYTRLGCFADAPKPDPGWRIPPAAVATVDPAHLLALRAAEEAIADARLSAPDWDWDRDRTGTFLGYMACQGRKLLAEIPFHLSVLADELGPALRARGVPSRDVDALLAEVSRRVQVGLPPASEDSLAGWLGSVAAARIARRFGLRGPQLAVESACASTLAALGAAASALRDGTCDTALAGGLWGDMQPEFYVGSCRFSALSATGSTPFDARANGFVPGEGAGIFVLRCLSAAERDGQRIHAVVREVAASSDGRGKSVLAPSAEGEALAMRRALDDTGLDPTLIDYVECHGTGTVLGDATEIDALTRAYGRGRARPLRVGSVKSNLGHLLAAAAAPALVKAVLAVREGVLPPSLGVERPSPSIDFASGPVEVVRRTTPWEAPEGEPRRAGVSAFGLGGTNVHAIVEEYRSAPRAAASPSPALPRLARLPIAAAGGRDVVDCAARLQRLAAACRRSDAYPDTLAGGWGEATRAPYRVAVVASDPDALEAKVALLRRAIADGTDLRLLQSQGIHAAAAAPAPRVAAIFPGQGPQYPNMLREALASFPSLGRTLAEADRAYEAQCGRRLTEAFFTDDPERHVQADEDAHCAVFVVNIALYRLLVRFGLRPAALMGQSAGELAALVAGGAVGFEDGLALVRERTRSVLAIETADPGRMIALACGASRARLFLENLPGYAALAADNGPGACIVSTDARALSPLLACAAAAGVEANVLPVSHGYHSELIAKARPRYLQHLANVPFRPSHVEIVSTVTGRSLADLPPERLPGHLARQFVEPVRLAPAVEDLYARGIRIFVECGPKWGLSTFVGHILGDRPHVAQATLHPKVGEAEQIHRALAGLFVQGAVTLTESEEDQPMTIHDSPTLDSASLASAGRPAPPPGGDLVALLEGIRDLIDGYLRHAREGATTSPPARKNGHARPLDGEEAPFLALEVPPSKRLHPTAAPATPAATATPAALAPPPAPAHPSHAILKMLLEEYARRTGYPEEMLAPDLDLEAELGIDTVKQVAVLAAVREKLGVAPDPAFKLRDASTIAKAATWLSGRTGALAPAAAARGPEAIPSSAGARAPGMPAAAAPPAPVAAAPLPPAQDDVRARIRGMLLDEYVRRTGYPEEMLAPDLDLEAELGIDTVKQVAVLAAVRETLGLAPDPAFKLRDASTLDRAVEVLARWHERGRPDGDGGPPPAGGGAPRPAADLSGSPPVLGECSAPPAAAGARARLLAALLRSANVGTIGEISSLAFRRSTSDRPARDPLVEVAAAAPDGVQLRAVLGDSSAEAKVSRGGTSPQAPAASPEILAALAPAGRPRAASGEELRAALDPGQEHAAELLGWGRSDGFMIATGGAQLRGEDEPARIASILVCAGELASYAWHGLTGAPHATAAVERARFHAVPADGADIAFHAKMVPPEGGLWRADVQVICDGRVVADIRGLAGIPTAATAAAGPAAESAARAWHRLTRRLSGHRAEEVA